MLELLRFCCADEHIYYWQDKSHRDVDFVIRRSREQIDAVECKINPDRLNPDGIAAFRKRYPQSENFVLVPRIQTPYRIRRKNLIVTVCTPSDLT